MIASRLRGVALAPPHRCPNSDSISELMNRKGLLLSPAGRGTKIAPAPCPLLRNHSIRFLPGRIFGGPVVCAPFPSKGCRYGTRRRRIHPIRVFQRREGG